MLIVHVYKNGLIPSSVLCRSACHCATYVRLKLSNYISGTNLVCIGLMVVIVIIDVGRPLALGGQQQLPVCEKTIVIQIIDIKQY